MEFSSPDILLQALARLDQRLTDVVAQVQVFHAEAGNEYEEYRGLYLSREEVERLLADGPLSQVFHVGQAEWGASSSVDSTLSWLMHHFALSAFDMDILLIALAPEIDTRYERIYAYIQDDVSRKRPSVDLALKLLCPSVQEKLTRYQHFWAQGPLLKHGFLHLVPDSHQVEPALLAHYLKIDERIVRFLLGERSLDTRLLSFCRLIPGKEDLHPRVESDRVLALERLAQQAREDRRQRKLYFCGPAGSGQYEQASVLATILDMSLLQVDVARLVVESVDKAEAMLFLLVREARLQQAMLFLTDIDPLARPEHGLFRSRLWTILAEYDGWLILCGSETGVPVEQLPECITHIPFTYPDLPARKACWCAEAELHQLRLAEDDLDALSSRFRLTFVQIARALAMACNERDWRISQGCERSGTQPDRPDLFRAARAQTGHELAGLARKVESRLSWDDLVLPQEQVAQLRDLCDQARYRHIVYDQWGLARKVASQDLNALFSGPPGTGKTMAAGIIAAELGLDLYKIDLAQVVSKYIGETEKNLQRIFQAAEHANAVLFFDEADTLFGKRTQVKDAHDRYANVEIGYLLQQMEEYDGVALLATNLPANIDEAFLRRLKFSIEFPFPDESARLLIWQDFFPAAVPASDELDFPFLARQLKLAGGNIKNIALSAAFLAAARDEQVSMRHIIRAAHREYQKMGKMSLEAEFGQYYSMVNCV